MYAQLLLNLPVDKVFDYAVPASLQEEIEVGKRVWVEFRGRRTVGYVVGLSDKSDQRRIKEIERVIDEKPIVDSFLFSLSNWISKYYFCSWGEALAIGLPSVLRKGQRRVVKKERKKRLEKKEKEQKVCLSPHQISVFKQIKEAIERDENQVFLLYAEREEREKIYWQLIDHLLGQEKGVISLFPEIETAERVARKFISCFGEAVARWHSRLCAREQFEEWQRMREGKAKVVIGTRLGVFSPVRNLSLIIVDEEESNSYKEENMPRYNARDLAIKRGEIEGKVVVLGSAVPSVGSYYRAKKKEYRLLEIRRGQRWTKIKLIDRSRQPFSFSPFLKRKIEESLNRKEGVILYKHLGGKGILKGEEFSKIGLIGVISTESVLNLPNFLSSERTFALLSTLIKRAEEEKAELVIQTYNPSHFSVVCALEGNYEEFYRKEIAYRKELNYPPFLHFINIIFKKGKQKKERIERLAEILKEKVEAEVLGPVLFSDIYYLTLKTKEVLKLNEKLKEILGGFGRGKKRIVVDVDPLFFF